MPVVAYIYDMFRNINAFVGDFFLCVGIVSRTHRRRKNIYDTITLFYMEPLNIIPLIAYKWHHIP